MNDEKQDENNDDYLLFPLFQPEQGKSDQRIVEHLLKNRVARMRANLDKITHHLREQVRIVDGHVNFTNIRAEKKRMSKMRQSTFNHLIRFQRSAWIAIDLQFKLRELEKQT